MSRRKTSPWPAKPPPDGPVAKKKSYHHGNLRAALVEAALKLIEEKGPTGFTLSEAAKQAGVTPAAVYRHFGGREDLIAEQVITRGVQKLVCRNRFMALV